jgi:hypothetical protein
MAKVLAHPGYVLLSAPAAGQRNGIIKLLGIVAYDPRYA